MLLHPRRCLQCRSSLSFGVRRPANQIDSTLPLWRSAFVNMHKKWLSTSFKRFPEKFDKSMCMHIYLLHLILDKFGVNARAQLDLPIRIIPFIYPISHLS